MGVSSAEGVVQPERARSAMKRSFRNVGRVDKVDRLDRVDKKTRLAGLPFMRERTIRL
jgi:hypothetical protein